MWKFVLAFSILICGYVISGATVKEALLGCRVRQTMAWKECGNKIKCPSTCQNEADCTFPYCDSIGRCQCRKVWCTSPRSCDFFKIDCAGNFACDAGDCVCHDVAPPHNISLPNPPSNVDTPRM